MHFLRIKHRVEKADPDIVMERLAMLLQEDDDINFDVLVNEQLLEFYTLAPQQSTLASNFYVIEKNEQDMDGNATTNFMGRINADLNTR